MKDSKKPETICPLMSGVSADGAPSYLPCDPDRCMAAVNVRTGSGNRMWGCGLNIAIPKSSIIDPYFNFIRMADY